MATAGKYPPGAEAALITAVNTFHDVAASNPVFYATTSAAIATLGSKASDFVTKYNICQVPETRTKPALEAKAASKADLLAYFRPLFRAVTNAVTMDNTKRAALAIPLRDDTPTPINPPATPPDAELAGVTGWTAKFRVREAGSEGRSSLPDGVAMLFIWSHVGAEPPTNLEDYDFEGPSSRAVFEVEFLPSVPLGSKAWVCCQWVTARGLTSPACNPIPLLVGGGVTSVAS